MTTLHIRWATGPNDRPKEGEALARLLNGGTTRETHTGAGRNGSDLHVTRRHVLLSVETSDGRRLVTDWRSGGAPNLGDLTEAWRDAWEAHHVGRPAGLTTVTNDEQLRQPIREMRRDHVRITTPAIAARSGFTLAEVRGYLKVTNRTLAEFLRSF